MSRVMTGVERGAGRGRAPVSRPSMSLVVLLCAGFLMFAGSPGRAAGAGRVVSGTVSRPSADVIFLRDGAGVFDAASYEEVKQALENLYVDTGVEVYVLTEVLKNLDEIELYAYERFKQIVKERGHYRIVLVFIGVDPVRTRLSISTNLGAGVYHLISTSDVEGLFSLGKGERFSCAVIVRGLERLARKIHSTSMRLKRKGTVPVTRGWFRRAVGGRVVEVLVLLSILLAGVVWYVWYRDRYCPRCGARLRRNVTLMGRGAWGEGERRRFAVKTVKCFECGYTARRRFYFF